MVGSKYWIPKHQNHQNTKLLPFRYERILTNGNKTGFKPVSRTCGTGSGISYRDKIEVSLVLKLCQQTKIKKPNFPRHPW